ncbi:MAG: DUF3611 family protein [Cyanobacteria bacterium P01_E01_bin.34]
MTESNLPRTNPESVPLPLAKAFLKLGWISFWLQFALGIIPVLLLLFALLFRGVTTDGPGTTVEVSLAYTSLVFLLFSIFWSFRYTRMGRSLLNSDRRPSSSHVMRMLRIGLFGNLIGMVCSLLVAMGAVGAMLLNVLSQPQGAILTDPRIGIGPPGLASNQWIVPLDVVWLQALLNNMAAQLVGILVTLYLLNRFLKSR